MDHHHMGHDHSMMNHTHPTMNHSDHMNHSAIMDHSGHGAHESMKSMGDMDHSAHGAAHSGMHMMMSMTFHFGYSEKILFDFWDVSSISGFLSSFIGIFFISLVYEGIKYYREYLFWENLNSVHYKSVNGQPKRTSMTDPIEPIPSPKVWSSFNGFQTFLHMIQMTISYMLMLIFMTFNVWLCVAVVLGSSTGYFFFGWKKTLVVDRMEHCH